MSNYVKAKMTKLEFEGDNLEVTVKVLELVDLMKLQSAETPEDMTAWAIEAIPKYVTVTGLRDADGNALNVNDIVSNAYFLSLLMQIVALMTESVKPANPLKPSVP